MILRKNSYIWRGQLCDTKGCKNFAEVKNLCKKCYDKKRIKPFIKVLSECNEEEKEKIRKWSEEKKVSVKFRE